MFRLPIALCLLSAAAVLGYNGNDAAPMKSVFTIEKDGKPVCAAAMLVNIPVNATYHKGFFVTAAHCVRGAESKLKIVAKNGKGEVYRVIVHPYYKPHLLDYDIAVVKARWGTKIDEAEDLIPADSENKPAANATFHVLKEDGKMPISANVIDGKSCQDQMGTSIRVSGKMVCASVEGNVTDGSPLIWTVTKTEGKTDGVKKYLMGVAFFSAKDKKPRIFTKMTHSEIYSFIKTNIEI